jgi:glycosyltransferase involved in cell wall biosynthesis
MIYFLHPLIDSVTPVGGILKIFDHVAVLREHGYPATTVYYRDEILTSNVLCEEADVNLVLQWTDYNLNSISFQTMIAAIKKDDVVVVPEIRPHLIRFICHEVKKVCFIQNWHKILPPHFALSPGDTYASVGFHFVITCGDFLSQYVSGRIEDERGGNHIAGGIPVFTVNNSINHNIFYRDDTKRVYGRVIMLARKGRAFIPGITRLGRILPCTFINIHKTITQAALAEEFRKSDIYIHTGFPEGLPLPPLEAQASGCVAIGFAGGGGLENMIHMQTSLVSNDGDVNDIVRNLKMLMDEPRVKEELREAGHKNALAHSRVSEKEKLLRAFQHIVTTAL